MSGASTPAIGSMMNGRESGGGASRLAGKSGDQLASRWEQLQAKLAIPTCEFGIIAGGRGKDAGRNPLIRGDDDFIVRVEETRLAGAADFAVLPVWHAFRMNDSRVQQYTKQFIETGYFVAADQRNPIPREPANG